MKLFNTIKNNKTFTRFAAGLLVSLNIATLPALAHETFLLPDQSVWQVDSDVKIKMASGLSFPDLTWGVSQDRISTVIVQLNGKTLPSPSFTDGKAFLTIGFTAKQAGVGVIAVSSKKRSGDIKHENTEGYLDEIGAPESVRQAFKALPGKPVLHRSYVKHTKSFICIEDCKDSQHVNAKAVGQKLEFIAARDDANHFQLLLDGKPLPNHEVKVRDAAKVLYKFNTDANGLLSIDEKISGTIMLAAVAITLPEKTDGLYHSDYATLVLTKE